MNVKASIAVALACSLMVSSVAPAKPAAPGLIASSKVAVVRTEAGSVQGFLRDGIATFRGIPYARAERFMPPNKVAPWTGTKFALSYGAICPQPISADLPEPQTFLTDNRYWPMSERCQNLNIWSPRLDTKKRPVMVWLHGGGFSSGSSLESPVYDGSTLSRTGDVVVVSINHRLNVLGFLDLSAYGQAYRLSGNVGMLDIVAALGWVRDNIAAFGGDPSNVTIFGQSGGGGKVATLLAAPSAHGLFDKAIIQSGFFGLPGGPEKSRSTTRRVAELTFRDAGLANGDVKSLQALPYEALLAASNKALGEVSEGMFPAPPGTPPGFPRVNWSPVVDDDFLPEEPFAASAPAISARIPLLIGSTLNEFSRLPSPATRGREAWTAGDVNAYLERKYGARSPAFTAAYRHAYPALSPREWPTIDTRARAATLRAAALKAAQPAPVYNYLFTWQSPILDGFWGAGHSMDLTFTFGNARLGEQATGAGPEVERLANRISRAWIAFARTGNPNTSALPNWPAFTATRQVTMILDNRPVVRVAHDNALLEIANAAPGK